MPNYTVGSARVPLEQPDLTTFQANGSVVLDSRRVQPFWFDGRFLRALDLQREQDYFLERQADLGQAAGFQTIDGLMVDQTNAAGQFVGSGAIVIHAGEGVTPAGEMVSVPNDLTVQLSSLTEQPILDVQFGLSQAPSASTQKRTGLYVVALQPLEYTANSIAAYPTTVNGPRSTHDGDIVESSAVSLVPYPNPPSAYPAALQRAALARQIFVTGSPSALPDSLLPLALVNVQEGVITWVDTYLVRRDTGAQFSGVSFGLADPVVQQAYAMQYDVQLQTIVAARQASGLKANFAASDYLLSIPSGGRYPLDAIDTGNFSQVFFPQEMDVRLSIVPSDELPALLQDSMTLPPIDLTLSSDAYASMAVFAFVPVPRSAFTALKNSLPETPLNPILPQVLANRSPRQLLGLFQGTVNITSVPAVSNNAWATAIGTQKYGFYLRRPSSPTLVPFTTPTGVLLSSSVNPSSFGQPVTFTAGLSPASATGDIEFLDGTSSLGSVPIAGGIASVTVSTLAVGAHPITAAYAGDAGDAAGTSAVVTQTVNQAAAGVTVVSSANPSVLGQSIQFSARVLPAAATGNIQFLDGTTVLGSAAVTGGVATLATASLAVGTHSITVAYSGDANDTPATSAVLTQIVNKVSSSVTLASSVDPSALGQSVTLTAKVAPATATGSVQFRDGARALGTGALDAGTATLAVSTLAAGAHSLTAAYAGDANDAAGTSAPLLQTVNKANTTIVLSSSLDPSTLGQSVLFTAKLTPSSATGSIQFMDGAVALGTATVSGGSATLPDATLAVGAHSITAVYSGDANDAAATSAVLTQTVNKSSSGVALSSSANPSTLNQPVTFTATISVATATGTVQFLDGTAVIGSGTVNGAKATLTDSSLTVGAHSITAAYSGDGNNAASVSAPLTQTVDKAASSVTLSSSVNPSAPGQSVTFLAKVSPTTATGAVQFLDGTTTLGTGALSGGTASLSNASLAVGTHSITAVYNGDANAAASTSAALSQVVDKTVVSVTVASSVNPSAPGQSVTFAAKVTPATATGSVEFRDGSTSLGTGTLNGGTASLADAALAVGTHSITAVYGGDANDNTATSAVLTQVVNKVASNVALTSSLNPSAPGQSVTFTAKITPTTATGSIEFLDGTVSIGTGTLNGGTAALADAALAIGTHSITAVYSGDANSGVATSAPVTQVVNKAASSVTLGSSLNPASHGQSVSFTAKVTPATATGSVQFFDGTTSLGTGALNAGTATLADASLAVGTHAITAVYGGDASNAGSTSAVLTEVVNKVASSVTLSSSVNPSSPGQPVIVTAKVTPAAATGSVQFLDGTAIVATNSLNAGATTLTSTSFAIGNHSLTGVYGGDGNDAGSTSAVLVQTVNRAAATMTLASSANPSTAGQAVTFTARVTPATATGSVSFLDGTAVLGTGALNGGVAQFIAQEMSTGKGALAAGTHAISATYAGDTNIGPASAKLTQTVNQQVIQ